MCLCVYISIYVCSAGLKSEVMLLTKGVSFPGPSKKRTDAFAPGVGVM